jgi:hypothetical protein
MTRDRLILLIHFMSGFILILMFRMWESWWPAWAVENRSRFMGIVILVDLFLMLVSPLLIEANGNPHTLTGPGRVS